jgi:ribosome maturation factor RimP
MAELIKKISEIVRNITAEFGFLLVDINIRGNDRNRIIELFVDAEKNVSAEDLAELSRAINNYFEENNLIEDSYRLDVSTPGVDRPLKFLEQYSKHINRKFEVRYKSGEDEQTITAKLNSIEGDDLIFSNEKTLVKINIKDILSAKVLISFS